MVRAFLLAVGVFLGAAAATAPALAAAAETRIYVALQGNDQWTGSLAAPNADATDGPLATLVRAQALARAGKQAAAGNAPRGPIRVLIGPGTYELAAPLVFTAADSGTAEAPVSYEAVTAGTVTLSGGIRLKARSAARAGQPAVFDLPPAGADTWRGGGQLFVNGERATLARQPKAGKTWFVQRSVPLESEPEAQKGHQAFAPSADALAWLTGLSAAERSRAVVQLLHSWNSSQHHVSDVNAATGVVRLTPPSKWAFLSTGPSQRWYVENVPSALTAGGEWIATDTDVRYLPTPAQAAQPLDAVLPVLERLVVIRGDAAAGQWVDHLAFRGLKFAHTRFLTPADGFVDPQAAIGVGAAIEVDGARHLTLDQCSVSQTGGYGVWLRRSVADSRIAGSDFHDLGGGGVQIGVARAAPTDGQATARNTVQNNRISDTGQVFPGAVGIWIGQAYDATVSNNFIHDTSYTGISVGWTWGFGPAASGRHTISNNLLVNIGGARLSDQGGIYTLGTLTGTVISGNVIREVRAYPAYGPGPTGGAWGIYNDEGTSGVVVENNIVVGTDSGGYHLNKGRANSVRNNLFAGGTTGEVRLSQLDSGAPQATLDGNILISKAGQPFAALATAQNLAFTRNLVSGTGAALPLDLAKCGAGCETSKAAVSAAADPKALVFTGLDAATTARLAATVAAAGAQSAGLAAGKATLVRAQATADVAAPLPLVIDLASARLGTQPAGLRYSPAGDTAAITLVENQQAPGGRCLRFIDSASMANRYDPHAFATLNHDTGVTTDTFAILIDADTDFIHEWRDNGQPYLIGPSLRITAAGISANGKQVAPAAVGQWMQLRMTAALGPAAGTWSLDVTLPNAATQTISGLRTVSPLWRRLNYVGYISNAAQTTTLCLAGVTVTNKTGQN